MFGVLSAKNRVITKAVSKSPWLFNQWVQHSTFVEFHNSPWKTLSVPINESRLALITTGGVHLKHQRPFDMNDPVGDPTFREIPADTRLSDLTITHNYYDHSDAEKDINIVMPVERVRTLASSEDIGDVNHRHFSFMGHIKDRYLPELANKTVPRIADLLIADDVDIVILTPA